MAKQLEFYSNGFKIITKDNRLDITICPVYWDKSLGVSVKLSKDELEKLANMLVTHAGGIDASS